jgi:putative DNA primase/helicase
VRELNITLFDSAKQKHGEPLTISWRKLSRFLTKHEATAQKDGAAFGFYKLKPGSTRANANTEFADLVALDFDQCIAYGEISEAAKPYAHAFHTSYSHTVECPKGRLVLPLSRPAKASEWPDVWRGAYRLTGKIADSQAKDVSRLYYTARHPVGSEALAFAQVNEGEWINTDWLIERGKQNDPGDAAAIALASLAGNSVAATYPFDIDRIKSALSRVDWDSREMWRNAGMALHSTGKGALAFDLWTEYSKASEKFNPESQQQTWAGFQSNRDSAITLGTLYHMAGQTALAASTNEERPARSELGLAMRFITQHGNCIRYVVDERCFLVWSGTLWERDTSDNMAIQQRMVKTVRSIPQNEIAAIMDVNPEEAKRLATWTIDKAQKIQTVKAAIEFVKSDPSVAIKSRDLDSGSRTLQIENGVLNLATGELTDFSPSNLLTRATRASYIANGEAPTWARFLNDVTDADSDFQGYLQRAVGYSLSSECTEQVFFFLFGLGSNGKSVFLNVLRELAGSHCTTAQATSFMLHSKTGGGASPDIAALNNRRVVCVAEIPIGQRLDEAMIKSLTGGEEMSARPLYGAPFTFTPRFKLWFAGNHKPTIKGSDHGIWRRVQLIPFTVTISAEKKDPNLLEKLRHELPGILNWAVAGYQEWKRIGLNPPEVIREQVKEYKREEDVLAEWLEDCCDHGVDGRATRDELQQSYITYCARTGVRSMSAKALYAALKERGFAETKRSGIRCFSALSMKILDATRPA